MKAKKKLFSFLTAFVMAFTVFGCTGMSFAEETPETPVDDQKVQTMGEAEPDAVNETDGSDENAVSSEATLPDENTDSVDEGEVEVMEASADSVKSTSVILTWDAVEPQFGGQVYYKISADPTIAEVTVNDGTTTKPVSGLKPGTKYTFTVQAYEPNPEIGADEAVGDAQTIIVATKLATPTKKSSTSTVTTLSFTWNAVNASNGGAITYSIYESKDAKAIANNLKTTTWKKTNLTQRGSLTHTYYIKAFGTLDDGTAVESDFGTLSATLKNFKEQKLSGLISDPGYKAVLLEWNRLDGATGYKIYWRQGGERGNIDSVGKDSDGHNMKTYRSKKTRKYEVVKKPGKYEYLTTVKNPESGAKVKFDKRGLKELNHTYVYFYQFMIIPYYDDDDGAPIYTSAIPENKWKDSTVNKTTSAVAGKSDPTKGIIRNNTVLPMYVLEYAKVNKPIYKTCSMNDGKKRGRLAKGHKFICFDKANGRVKFYEKKNVSNPKDTFWFAQKNAHTIQGYYMNNGNMNDLNRKDWKTGYSKKTVLDYVNKSGLSSKTGYLIWASKYAQHVYVFTGKKGHWKLLNDGKTTGWNNKAIWSNLCTSGRVNIQSRNGNYVIFGKQHTAKRAKYTYYYLSKLHKTVRLHSLLHKKGQKFGGKLYNVSLGNPVSKGCIRLRPKVSKWIYDKVPKKTRCKVW